MSNQLPAGHDVTRTTIAVFSVVLLAAASLWVLQPFLLALVWAATIVIATWPLLLGVQARVGGRRTVAAALMVIVLLAVFVVPAVFAVGVIVGSADDVVGYAKQLQSGEESLVLPEWLVGLPLVGERIEAGWAELEVDRVLTKEVAGYVMQVGGWLLAQLQRFGLLVVNFLLTAVLAAILYVRGEVAGAAVRRFAGRLAGVRGEEVTDLAAKAIRSVALGVVVTALLQSVAGGFGLWVTGVPLAAILTALMFLLSIAQVGAAPVLALATVWLFIEDHIGAGIFLGIWTLVVSSMDNVIRPVLIRRGVELPLLLIFAGVIGGLLAFGVIGIFVGPVLLAVTYTLLGAWMRAPDATVTISTRSDR